MFASSANKPKAQTDQNYVWHNLSLSQENRRQQAMKTICPAHSHCLLIDFYQQKKEEEKVHRFLICTAALHSTK